MPHVSSAILVMASDHITTPSNSNCRRRSTFRTEPIQLNHAILSSIYKKTRQVTTSALSSSKRISMSKVNNTKPTQFTEEEFNTALSFFFPDFFNTISCKLEAFILNSIPQTFVERNEKFHKRFATFWEEKFKSIVEMSTLRIITYFVQNFTNTENGSEKYMGIINFIRGELERRQTNQTSIENEFLPPEGVETFPEEKETKPETVEGDSPSTEECESCTNTTIIIECASDPQTDAVNDLAVVDEEADEYEELTSQNPHSHPKLSQNELQNSTNMEFESLKDLPEVLLKLFEKNMLSKFIEESVRLRNEVLDTLSEF